MKSAIPSSSDGGVSGGGPAGDLGERLTRHPMRLRRQLPGALDSELAHVCALPVTLIATSWLSQCIVGAGHVKYVVDDLEQHAQLRCETAEGRCLWSVFDPRQQ